MIDNLNHSSGGLQKLIILFILIHCRIAFPLDNIIDVPLTQELTIFSNHSDDSNNTKISPHFLMSSNVLIYTTNRSGPIHACNISNMDSIWSYEFFSDRRCFLLNASDSMAFISFWTSGQFTDSIKSFNMFTGEIKWSAKAHDFNGIGFRKSMIHKDLFIYCGSENIYAIELNSGYLRMALRYHYDHGDIIDKKIFLAGIRPNINDSCSILWGMDDRVYCLNPYYGTIYRTFYPGPNIKPSGLPDGYDGFGNVIDSGESEIVCYIYSLRKYDPRLFSVDIKNWTTLWKYEDYTLREAFIYNDDAFILKESEIIKSNARDGKEQWNIKLGRGHIVLSHAISDRIIYITEKWMENGNRSALFAVNIDTGEIIWRDILLGRIQSAPKIYGNKLYLIYSPNDPYDNISILRVYDHNGATATINK